MRGSRKVRYESLLTAEEIRKTSSSYSRENFSGMITDTTGAEISLVFKETARLVIRLVALQCYEFQNNCTRTVSFYKEKVCRFLCFIKLIKKANFDGASPLILKYDASAGSCKYFFFRFPKTGEQSRWRIQSSILLRSHRSNDMWTYALIDYLNSCVIGTDNRFSFPKKANRSDAVGFLVHLNTKTLDEFLCDHS